MLRRLARSVAVLSTTTVLSWAASALAQPRAFSAKVDTGSAAENVANKEIQNGFRFHESANRSHSRLSAGDVLQRLHRLARTQDLAELSVSRKILEITFEPKEGYNLGPGRPQFYESHAVPAYISGRNRSLLRVMPPDSPSFEGRRPDRPSVMLNLMIEREALCIRAPQIQAEFGSRGEWRQPRLPHTVSDPILVYPIRNRHPREIWFKVRPDGCLSEVTINDNCFTAFSRGCTVTPNPHWQGTVP